jgi:hypothetical protein
MRRPERFFAAAVVASLLVLALSYLLRSWGGVMLVALGAGAAAWYRAQVAEGEEGQAFFGDAGEDSRQSVLQPGDGNDPSLAHRAAPPYPRSPSGGRG